MINLTIIIENSGYLSCRKCCMCCLILILQIETLYIIYEMHVVNPLDHYV